MENKVFDIDRIDMIRDFFVISPSQEVIILSRKAAADHENCKTRVWDGRTEGDWANNLNDADLLINLCGKNVNCRYTEKNKAEIINSRIIPTKLLGAVAAGTGRYSD